jgi:membrane-bound hydrogenase subunit beta
MTMTEEKIKQCLEEKFAYLSGAVNVTRKRRIFARLPLEKFREVFDHALSKMDFTWLSAISGTDAGDGFVVMYHLNREGAIVLSLEVPLPRENPVVRTVTDVFPGADIYERELMDLLGIRVEGLAPGHRYPLPDEAPKDQFPLRKDFKSGRAGTEVNHA